MSSIILSDNKIMRTNQSTCTEKCCDSKSSQKIISVLGQMDQLANYTKDTLIFKGTFPSATYLDDLNQFLLFGEVCVVLVKQE